MSSSPGSDRRAAPIGVIFDMDGVLIDSGAAHWESWKALGREHGITLDEAKFRRTFGRRNEDCINELFGPQPSPQRYLELARRKEFLYRELFAEQVRPVAGAVELLAACHAAGFALAVGSSAPPENIKLAVQLLRAEAYFDAIVHGEEVTRGKPDPQVFIMAAERLGIAPTHCAVLEDAPAGLLAARRGGMLAIGLAGTHAREHLSDAHLVIDGLAELSPARLHDLVMSHAQRLA
jgi:HAD superfamily hydrolase (TIGR01509 family)